MNVSEFKQRHHFVDTFMVKVGDRYEDKSFEYMKLCFVFRLYWIGRMEEHAAGLLQYYEQVWPRIAPHVLGWRNATKRGRPSKVNRDTEGILRNWLSQPSSAPPVMCLFDIYNRMNDFVGADIRLHFRALDFRNGGSIELYLPAEGVEADPKQYADWCAELASTFQFCSGNAGYGLAIGDHEAKSAADEQLYSLSKHYPGLDVGARFSNYLGQGIKGVNWLTFLNPNFVERLGGREMLGAALQLPEVVVVDLPTGVMIQAGTRPELGDNNSQENCPHYQAVGRVLAPIRDRNYPQILWNDDCFLGSTERTQEWLSRFD